jgi:transcriptional regulator with XRE-family HTH domain
MKAEHSFQNNDLSFALHEAIDPQVSGPSRFARALKQARFARGWTQAELAAQLSIPKRAITSWETAERLPSVGMVILLLDVLTSEEELSLNRELLGAYIVDDLERQAQRRDGESPFSRRVQRVIGRMAQLSTGYTATSSRSGSPIAEEKAGDTFEERRAPPPQEGDLEPLFALMTQLHQYPELIPVARDFIREMVPGG